jgi:hypothetical protein
MAYWLSASGTPSHVGNAVFRSGDFTAECADVVSSDAHKTFICSDRPRQLLGLFDMAAPLASSCASMLALTKSPERTVPFLLTRWSLVGYESAPSDELDVALLCSTSHSYLHFGAACAATWGSFEASARDLFVDTAADCSLNVIAVALSTAILAAIDPAADIVSSCSLLVLHPPPATAGDLSGPVGRRVCSTSDRRIVTIG